MLSIHTLASIIARHILSCTHRPGVTPDEGEKERAEIVAYGLEVALGAIVEVLAITGGAAVLGLLPEVTVALLTQALYRFGSGGAHCRAYYRCLVSSVIFLTLLGYGGRWLEQLWGGEFPLGVFSLLAAISGVLAVRRWAPADTPANPIQDLHRRRRLKNFSLAFLLVWFFFTLAAAGKIRRSCLYASVLAVIMQTVTITPLGYRLMDRLDEVLCRLIPLEGRR